MKPQLSGSVEVDGYVFSRKALWIGRIVIVCLFALWLVCVCYLRAQIRRDKAKVEQNRIEAARREEFLRRGVQYRQELDEFNQGVRSRNVFDGK